MKKKDKKMLEPKRYFSILFIVLAISIWCCNIYDLYCSCDFEFNYNNRISMNGELLIISFLLPCVYHTLVVLWNSIIKDRSFLVLRPKQYWILGLIQSMLVLFGFDILFGNYAIGLLAVTIYFLILLLGSANCTGTDNEKH